MSFGSAMRFEVKDGGKGGIFWQKEKPKQKPRKFGYKTKELRHALRRPEDEYIDEPQEKPRPSKDFVRRNRDQFRKAGPEEDKENQRSSSSTASGRASSSIKPGTVTLTQDQLNALLASVGKLKAGEAGNIRISVDAENNALQLESPRDNMESAPNSSRSDAGDKALGKEEVSILNLAKNNNATSQGMRGSSGQGREEKAGGSKEVRFNTARNEERFKTPEATPTLPPPVPWRHMTVAERKRLQWAREKEAEEELQRQRSYDPWGRPGAGAPQKKAEPDPQPDSQLALDQNEQLQKAIDAIEAKYGDLLKEPPEQKEKPPRTAKEDKKKNKAGEDSDRLVSAVLIPGLDSSYAIGKNAKEGGQPKAGKQLEDRGNTRPPRRPDRRDQRDIRKEREGKKEAKSAGQRPGEESEQGRRGGARGAEKQADGGGRKEAEAGPRAASSDAPLAAPAAMQTSLFIGQSEPDATRFLTKKEEERKRWVEELDRQIEEKRLQKQRDKEKQREELDDTWADRFVTAPPKPPPQPHPQPQSQTQSQLQPTSYSTAGAWDRSVAQVQNNNNAEPQALPPAAMRSAMSIGNIAPNTDQIELRQAEERRLWLEELNKQREEQREARMRLKDKQRESEETWANRFSHDPHTVPAETTSPGVPTPYEPAANSLKDQPANRVSSAPQPAVNEPLEQDAKTYLRGQNVHLDSVTRRELEEKRRKHLEYQAEIKAQIEEKEKQKREERECKWREEMEGEKKLQAERDALQKQLEAEHTRSRQREEVRQRQVEQLKSLMDAEQERAQEQRMMKRLATLQQAGHDISSLKAHYEALTPRLQQASLDPASVPGLVPAPWDSQGADNSPRPVHTTYMASEGAPSLQASQEVLSSQTFAHEPYTENRVLTPSYYRHPSQPRAFPASPLREFATQTDDQPRLSNGLRKELSEVEIEYQGPLQNTTTTTKETRAMRTKSAERKKPAEDSRGKPPPSKPARQKTQKQQRGKASVWNYQNPQLKAPMKQSEKDLFYQQKRQESEERRAKRERQLQYLVELNKQVIPSERQARPTHPTSQEVVNGDSDFLDREGVRGDGPDPGRGHGLVNGDVSHRSRSPPASHNGKHRPGSRNRSPPIPAVKRKTGHKPARDYDSDHDTHDAHSHYRPNHAFSPSLDERGNIQVPTRDTDFIPFTRTNDILDPSKAEDPIQLSRENTRIKQARQHYHENLRPADYGNQLDMYKDYQQQPAARVKDPILNPGLVKDHPTARQDQILQQLSSLKQSLIQRRREIETCMSPSDLEK